ncbi:hypothetical protein BSL78_09527 [Apostichopus japonicus]|uniref:Reverse transcriptase domain-containing protein n=1 Tax=Stichopus japonicus TaxID=307972 RepID=A0A2G8L024_STIJA|nr:hypothetical protein BSL78_09527 [Apostichopus japonicus]
MEKDIQSMIYMGIVTRGDGEYAFPLVALRKPDGTLRHCEDLRKLNQVTKVDAKPIPDQEEIFAKLSKDLFFSKIDLSKGYWQVPMDEKSKKYVSFITHGGLLPIRNYAFWLS